MSAVCPTCRATLLPGADICEQCGLVLASATVATTPAARCPGCHTPLGPLDDICEHCGLVQSSVVPPAPAPLPPVEAPAPAPVPAPASEDPAPRQSAGLELGTVLASKYRIDKEIGSGGMGKVYLGEDEVLKRPVVVKTLVAGDDAALARQAVQEREFLASVKHPNIVSIYDFFTIQTDGYIVMEYVPGQTLFELSESRGGPLTTEEAIGHVLQVLPAFGYLHKLGLVYCDFKPQNVILEELKDGSRTCKLIDLGTVIKYSDQPGAVYGTHGFYAPEAIHNPAPQTDLYSICRTLAWMVSWMDMDTPPFGMPAAEAYPIFQECPALYQLLVKGTHRVSSKRFQSAEALGNQLQGVLRVTAGARPGITVRSTLFTGVDTVLDAADKAADLLASGDTAWRGGNESTALMFYGQALATNPDSVDGHLRMADVHLSHGKYSEALADIAKVQRLDPGNWKIAWYTGRLLEKQNNLKEAAAQYQQLADDLPGELPPRQAVARVRMAQQDYAAAIALYKTITRADPDNTEAWMALAGCHAALSQWAEAADALGRVGEGASSFVEAQMEVVKICLGQQVPPDVPRAGVALTRLEGRTQDSQYFRLRGDYYRFLSGVAFAHLPKAVVTPGLPSGTPLNRTLLRSLAEQSYGQYLKRETEAPDREQVVRLKFSCAPWRLV